MSCWCSGVIHGLLGGLLVCCGFRLYGRTASFRDEMRVDVAISGSVEWMLTSCLWMCCWMLLSICSCCLMYCLSDSFGNGDGPVGVVAAWMIV